LLVGFAVGDAVGALVGSRVGDTVGVGVGTAVGETRQERVLKAKMSVEPRTGLAAHVNVGKKGMDGMLSCAGVVHAASE